MKTIRQWFEELPPGYRERALKNADPVFLIKKAKSLPLAVWSGLFWAKTPEGYDFWNAVSLGELPPLPDAPPPEDPVKLRAALDAVRAALPDSWCANVGCMCQGEFDDIVGEVLK